MFVTISHGRDNTHALIDTDKIESFEMGSNGYYGKSYIVNLQRNSYNINKSEYSKLMKVLNIPQEDWLS